MKRYQELDGYRSDTGEGECREYLYSRHADIERKNDHLTFRQLKEAILSGAMLEHYPDTGRGETCLVVGRPETRQYTECAGGMERRLCW